MNLKLEFLINSIKGRIEAQENYLERGDMRSYDIASDGGYNSAVNHEIEFLRDILSKINED